MNGFELAELMRGTERTRHIPIIFVSAAGREMNYAFKGYESGAVDFLQKPLDAARGRQQGQRLRRPVPPSQGAQARDGGPGRRTAEQEALVQQLQCGAAPSWSGRCACATTSCRWSRTSCARRSTRSTSRRRCASCTWARATWRPSRRSRLPAMIERDQRQIQNMVRLIDDMLDVAAHAQRRAVDPAQAGRPRRAGARRGREPGQPGRGRPARPSTSQASQPIDGVLGRVPHRAGADQPDHQRPALRRRQPGRRGRRCARSDRARDERARPGPRASRRRTRRRIFEQFERTDDSRKHAAGLGLGLYITREIVRAHGGEITVESAPGEGALFRVALPLHAPPDDA